MIPALPKMIQSYGKVLGEIEVGFLRELRRGHEASAPIDYAKSFGLETFEIKVRAPLDWSAIRELAESLEKKGPALVHAHDVKASTYLVLATLYLRLCRPASVTWKLVSTHHGIHGRNGAKIRIYELIYRWLVLRAFDAVLCVCSSDRKILIEQGLKPERVFAHLNGVDRPEVTAQARPSRQAEIRGKWERDFGIRLEGKKVLGVAARLAGEKNHSLLLKALFRLKGQNQDWVCICFGVGPLESRLRDMTRSLGLERFVYWGGYRVDLTDEMAGFDCLLSLSLGEGLPVNLLEAGWARTPILATAVDGVLDLLPSEDVELSSLRLAESLTPNDISLAIRGLVFDSKREKKLSDVYSNRVRNHFSGEIWRTCLFEIYQNIHKFTS